MNKPFNDEPVDVLVKKYLAKNGTVLDLRIKYIGDAGVDFLAKCPDLVDLEVLNLETVSYTHLRAHETSLHLVCRLPNSSP